MLRGILGVSLSELWEALLILPFDVPFIKTKGLKFRFRVGQPLGAYSSWAAFSLTHHAMVQFCAQKTGLYKGKWFTRYALLGDDIVIACESVAILYKKVLNKIGVDISLPKTIESNNGSCEFAKRFIWKGHDVSPVSFKEVYAMRRSTTSELVKRLSSYRAVSMKETYRWFGAGYKVMPLFHHPKPGRWRRFYLLLTSPGGPYPLPFYWWCSQFTNRPITQADSAIVHSELMEKWQFSFEPEGIPSDLEEDIVEEVLVGRPWIKSWLSTSTPFLLNLMAEDPITSWFHRPTVPSTPERRTQERVFRLGKMYWIYDRIVAISKKPPLKLLSA
jgi:hypothetical protein